MKFSAPLITCFVILPRLLLSAAADEGDADWWSLKPPARPIVPLQSKTSKPIDAFVQRKLSTLGLQLSPQADRHTLVRRIFLVMLGIPPSPAEITAFVSDPAPQEVAWQRLIDRVLADPRYGERWAQHWLDVIRWAETVGFETNAPRPNAWHYRDWVIDAFNADKPYHRFLFEQLAGDTISADAALGFLVAGPANLPGQIGRDEEAMRQARQDELDEVIRTISQAFFGLTIGCARCHDHKFDPITARDYYSMQAIFAGLHYGNRRLRGAENDVWSAKVPALKARVESLEKEVEAFRLAHELRPPLAPVQEERFAPIRATAIRMRIAATQNGGAASLYEFAVWSNGEQPVNIALASNGAVASASSFALENQTRHTDCLNDGTVDKRQAFPWRAASAGPAWIRIDLQQAAMIDQIVWHEGFGSPAHYVIEALQPNGEQWIEVAHTRDRLPNANDTRAAEHIPISTLDRDEKIQIVTLLGNLRKARSDLARFSAGPQVFAATFEKMPKESWLLNRGDPMQREEIVAPAVPAVLGNAGLKKNAAEPDRRRALARHLTDARHPLTARVAVNRVWQHHFGRGLVSTPSDFGKMGSPPSHPDLLDWLAVELVRQGWSLKKLHRTILTSKTFQQSSRPQAKASAVDAGARMLWRYPPRRIEAEVIRDSILATSGKLNHQRGGVGFDFFAQKGGLSDYSSHQTFDEDGWRRMVYARKIRMQAVDIFGAFDCPDAGQMKPLRTRSITPVQALSLMNSPFAIRQAKYFAERLRREAGATLSDQIGQAIELAFSRPAEPAEVTALEELASEHGLEQVCRVLFNTSEFIFLP